jgi:hypothetical protein
MFYVAWCNATEYIGCVVDETGAPILYATVYLRQDPMVGTATNAEGLFTLETEIDDSAMVVISYVGYEKILLPLSTLHVQENRVYMIRLREQPIALEEMVVQAKKTNV